MKHTLVLLTLCLVCTFTATTNTTTSASNQQLQIAADAQHPTIHSPTQADQTSHSNSTALVHHPQLTPIDLHHSTNHSHPTGRRWNPFEKAHFHDTPISHHAAGRNRAIHPRFRPLLRKHPKKKASLPKTTPSAALLPILTDKPANDDSHSSRSPLGITENYFQRRLRAFFGHQHEAFSPPPRRTRSWIKTGLRR